MSTPRAVPEAAAPALPGGQVGAIIRAAPLAAALYTPAADPPVTAAGREHGERADRPPAADGRDR
ncbi:hypothetical protein ACRYCC_32120 [Actinomadura scrupuli]|uniref:hypothetical protein n=1 Tax=Actinomadura scrupuli TaxID=559629 RepID=UPI003D97B58F